MKALKPILCVAALAACHAPSDVGSVQQPLGTNAIHGGTRLTALGYRIAGVARDYTSFHDNKLDFDCGIAEIDEGVAQCAPEFVITGPAFYADDGCSERAVSYASIGDAPALPPYVFVTDPTRLVPLHVGATFTGLVHRLDDAGTCVPAETLGILYRATEVPLDTFASGVVNRASLGSSLVGGTIAMDDGTTVPATLFDVLDNGACATDLLTGFCLPTNVAAPTAAGCATWSPIGSLSSAGVGPRFVESYVNGVVLFAPLGAPTMCGTTPNAFRIGSFRKVDTFPLLRPTTGGSDRIQAISFVSSLGLTVSQGLYDRELQVPCTPIADPAGGLRCYPGRGEIPFGATAFSDAACTQPLATDADYANSVNQKITHLTVGDQNGFYDIGAPYSGPVYQGGFATACTLAPSLITTHALTPRAKETFAPVTKQPL